MEPPSKRLRASMDKEEQVKQLLLPQLPEEVLHIIFSYLTDVRDLMNVRSVSRQFNQILKSSRVKWMFGEVLKISFPHEKEKGDFSWREQWKHFNTLRLVCKSWKRSVNTILENDPSHFSVDWDDDIVVKQGHLNTTCPVTFRIYERFRISERERIEQFTNYFMQQQARSSTYNPIPTRHLHIRFQRELPSQDWEAFSQQVAKYLQAFGNHVWYLTLGDSSVFDDLDLATVYNYLSEWVQLMPNVKSLVLDFLGGANARRLRPFPHLKDLTTCQFGRFCDSAYYVLKKNTHIRKLSILTNSILPKLMKIKFVHPLELALPLALTDSLFYVKTICCKIHKLRLECVGPVYLCKRFMMLFRMLKKNMLESLDLDMSKVYMLDGPFQEILDLPNLKHLHFSFPDNCLVDLDWFLGNLECLESLTLEAPDINKVFVSMGSKDNEEISDSECEGDGLPNFFDGMSESEDEEVSLDGEMPDDMEKEDDCEKEDSDGNEVVIVPVEREDDCEKEDVDGNEVVIVPVEKTATAKSKKNKRDYMVDFHQASLWKNLPNLKTVIICTSYFGWKQQQYTLNRPGMPTLTFEMYEL